MTTRVLCLLVAVTVVGTSLSIVSADDSLKQRQVWVLTNGVGVAPGLKAPGTPKAPGLMHPTNPPRSADGTPLPSNATNFALMYPMNPPRLVKIPDANAGGLKVMPFSNAPVFTATNWPVLKR